MSNEAVRTDANPRNISELLKEKKYKIDYYQREYRWESKHVGELITDLVDRFIYNYDETHDREIDGSRYGHYFLGPIILSHKGGQLYIVDGQQRLTTISLLLIYLSHLQNRLEIDDPVKLDDYICSTVRGKQSFNMQVPDREKAIESIYNDLPFELEGELESVQNIIVRYQELDELFPEELKEKHALLLFIDWLLYNVDMVEIVAFSDEEAYSIFETMNDRGLSLSPTEMLKGYLLANIEGNEKKEIANGIWKNRLLDLMNIHKNEEADFFKYWLRAKYSYSVRAGRKGSKNKDFEKIGTEFHKWVRDNKVKIGLTSSGEYWHFINTSFQKYSALYLKIRKYADNLTPGFEEIYYNAYNNFTLQYPLLISPIRENDESEVIDMKLKLVSKYIDYFISHRAVNYISLSYSSQKYTMATLAMSIRDMPVEELRNYLTNLAGELDGYFDGVPGTWRTGFKGLQVNQWSKRYIRYILARITAYIETKSGMEDRFVEYTSTNIKKPYEIEHLWANHFERHRNEFESSSDFSETRNSIGGLILVPRGFNQSYGDLVYTEKLPHYLEQNLIARSLHSQAYERNPSFNQFLQDSELPFKDYPNLLKADIEERAELYKLISEKIWDIDIFSNLSRN
jgi:uncharacterized protein with ParB-like and HNH nuclease domain